MFTFCTWSLLQTQIIFPKRGCTNTGLQVAQATEFNTVPRNEQRNILHEIRKRKANCIGHILRRNCLLQPVIEGKIKGQIEVTRRRGRRRKKLLDGLKERRGYCQLKEEALDRTMWRNRFGRGFGPVVSQITDDDDDDDCLIFLGAPSTGLASRGAFWRLDLRDTAVLVSP